VCAPDAFSSASGLTFYRDEIEKLGLAPTIVMMDPPEHSGKRRLLAKAFSPKRVAETEPLIRDYVRGRLAEMAERDHDGEVVDLHRDFSSRIPTFVLAHLFDLPAQDRPRFGPWVSALTTLQEEGFRPAGLEGGAVAAVVLIEPPVITSMANPTYCRATSSGVSSPPGRHHVGMVVHIVTTARAASLLLSGRNRPVATASATSVSTICCIRSRNRAMRR